MDEKEVKIYITKGISGCGKTTWAKQMTAESNGNIKNVCKDDLRLLLDNGEWSKANEKLIRKIRDSIILISIDSGKSIIVSDTNLHPSNERDIRKLVSGRNIEIEVKFFNTPIEECIARDALREGSACVGEDAIRRQAADWEKWKDVDCSAYEQDFTIIEVNDKLPKAIIVDIDGTLAKMSGRSPYEWYRVGEDAPVEEVVHLVRSFKFANPDTKIILFSGRSDECQRVTENWLNIYQIPYDELYMRTAQEAKDGINDRIIKAKLYDEHVAGKYHVQFIIDDRKSVKRMWVRRGLFVFDVNQHDIEF